MIWSKEEETILKELANKGYTARQINKVFPNRSIGSIQNKAARLNIGLAGVRPVINYDEFKRMMRPTCVS